MYDFKTILQSRTFWSGLVGFLVFMAKQFGLDEFAGVDQEALVNNIMNIVIGVAFIATMVFRAVATKRIN